MSRARENADGARLDAPLASPAFTGTPTGITGTHITSGTLGNTVQDNITRLGTVTSGNLSNSAIVYPAGHVLRTFYTESDAAAQSIAAGATLYWDELDLSIPASSTSDYLIITLNVNGILTNVAHSYLRIGLVYSTDSWSTPLQLGTVSSYDRPAYTVNNNTIVISSSITVRINHPITSAYRIRPRLYAFDGAINVCQQPSRSTILAVEIKG